MEMESNTICQQMAGAKDTIANQGGMRGRCARTNVDGIYDHHRLPSWRLPT